MHRLKGENQWRNGIGSCKTGTRQGIASERSGGPEAVMARVEDMEIFRTKEAQRTSQLLRMLHGQDREPEQRDNTTNLFTYSINSDHLPSHRLWENFSTLVPISVALFSGSGLLGHEYREIMGLHPPASCLNAD